MVKFNQASTFESPLSPFFPFPIVAKRAPTANDIGYALGQMWLNPDAATVYLLTKVQAGTAFWLEVNSGTYSVVIADEFTSPPGDDLDLIAPVGEDVIVRMGDDAGATQFQVRSLSDAIVSYFISTGASFALSYVGNQIGSYFGLLGGPGSFIGTASLSGGTILVPNVNITADDHIFLSYKGSGLTDTGQLSYTIVPGISFTIHSTNASDANDVSYLCFRETS